MLFFQMVCFERFILCAAGQCFLSVECTNVLLQGLCLFACGSKKESYESKLFSLSLSDTVQKALYYMKERLEVVSPPVLLVQISDQTLLLGLPRRALTL
jgi:hypothetical protein